MMAHTNTHAQNIEYTVHMFRISENTEMFQKTGHFCQKPMTKKSFSFQTFIYHSFTKDRISQRIKTFHKPPNHHGEMLL